MAVSRALAIALVTLLIGSACASYQAPLDIDRRICMAVGAGAGGAGGGVWSNENRNSHSNINWAIAAGAVGGAVLGYLLCDEAEAAVPPTASASAEPNRGEAPLTTRLRAVGRSAGEIKSYEWDFGDGSSGNGSEVTHTYDKPGDYNATLTVTDDQGLTGTAVASVRATSPAAKAPAPKRRIVLRGVTFAFDSADLTADSQIILEAAIEALSESPGARIEVGGHTDSTGPEGYNQGLSERRAQAVADYLSKGGLEASKLDVRGYGETQPVAGNDTRDGRSQNRRVSLNVMD
jgi:outer membrane protein OmpA-like peptidoglycan-associated protein